MAKTARSIITSSLRKLGVVASGETPSAEELQDGLTSLQGMLETWSQSDLFSDTETLGALLSVATVNTELDLPVAYIDAITYNLCVELADEFGGTLTPAIADLAEKKLMAIKMRNLAKDIPAFKSDDMYQGDRSRFGWSLSDFLEGGS
jgi:hypothetical protein